MIVGIGVDVVVTRRMERALAGGEAFAERVFTAAEREACHARADRAQALAARFAAKEACLKALGCGWGRGVDLTDVELRTAPGGQPVLALSGGAAARAILLNVRALHVSLTHESEVAAAIVVLEGDAVSPSA